MKPSETFWHKEVVLPNAWHVLDALHVLKLYPQFYLAGGTGLALFLGHRESYDFDFFSTEAFQEEILIHALSDLRDCTIEQRASETLHLTVNGVKVSFLGYHYPLLFPTQLLTLPSKYTVRIADIRDIAAMKVSAISSRGTKRDFVDLYMVAQDYGLRELLKLFHKKYLKTPYNRVHLLKSLMYFEDAEHDPMPKMKIALSWDSVKKFFIAEVPTLL